MLAIPFSLVFFLALVLPTMLVVLPLRLAGLMSWRVEAVSYPWGRRKPADVKAWRVKGHWGELQRVVNELAAALERGEQRPRVANAEPDDV